MQRASRSSSPAPPPARPDGPNSNVTSQHPRGRPAAAQKGGGGGGRSSARGFGSGRQRAQPGRAEVARRRRLRGGTHQVQRRGGQMPPTKEGLRQRQGPRSSRLGGGSCVARRHSHRGRPMSVSMKPLNHLIPTQIEVLDRRCLGQRDPQRHNIAGRPTLESQTSFDCHPRVEVLGVGPAVSDGVHHLLDHRPKPRGANGEGVQVRAHVAHLQRSIVSLRLQPVRSHKRRHRSQGALRCRLLEQLHARLAQEGGREPIEACQNFRMCRGRELHERVQTRPLTDETVGAPCGPHLPRMNPENAQFGDPPTTADGRSAA